MSYDPKLRRPVSMSITPINGEFWWDVSFSNDPRLPRMGRATTFTQALAAVQHTIKMINAAGPLPTEDRRPVTAPGTTP